jgi:hypothetical protein
VPSRPASPGLSGYESKANSLAIQAFVDSLVHTDEEADGNGSDGQNASSGKDGANRALSAQIVLVQGVSASRAGGFVA